MEPDDTINAVRSKEPLTPADVGLLRDMTRQFPNDPYLWDVLGDVVQMVDGIGNEYALQCYQNAVSADPNYGPAHNSLGYWYDIAEDYLAAKRHFEVAIELGVGDVARVGLAQILAQMGRDDDAYAVVNDCDEPEADRVAEVRQEIADGLLAPYFDIESEQQDGG